MAERSPNRQKTLWEKDKLLITSNSSFSCTAFERLVLKTCKKQGLFGNGLAGKALLILSLSCTNQIILSIPRFCNDQNE